MNRAVLKTNEAAATQSAAMESGDHFKNGAGSKSQTSRGNFLRKTIICTVITSVMCLFANYLAGQTATPEYTNWEIGGSYGLAADGQSTSPIVAGIHGAYFFNSKYGAGLVARRTYESGTRITSGINWDVQNLFYCAALFANWGQSNWKVYFPTRIGFGLNRHASNTANGTFVGYDIFGVYALAGISFRPVKLMSFGVFADYATPIDEFYLEYLGFNVGISFHF